MGVGVEEEVEVEVVVVKREVETGSEVEGVFDMEMEGGVKLLLFPFFFISYG